MDSIIIYSFNIMLDMDFWGVLSSVLMDFMFNADFWGETEVGDMISFCLFTSPE